MVDLISRKALGIGKCNPEVFESKEYAKGWNDAIDLIEKAPTIEAEPVRFGRWIDKKSAINYIVHSKCSACGSWQGADWMNFCPECGAKMDGGAEDGKTD